MMRRAPFFLAVQRAVIGLPSALGRIVLATGVLMALIAYTMLIGFLTGEA
ncbi:hypothetical protein [Sphingomonas sp.]|nr:hypothetical protein [Sphingomonas sp.]